MQPHSPLLSFNRSAWLKLCLAVSIFLTGCLHAPISQSEAGDRSDNETKKVAWQDHPPRQSAGATPSLFPLPTPIEGSLGAPVAPAPDLISYRFTLPKTERMIPRHSAPAISEISSPTYPGETLVITGDNLEESALTLWAEGELYEITPLRSDHNKMQAVIPDDLGLPKATMLVWPRKRGDATQVGLPIRVNGPEIWWRWPAHLDAESDQTQHIRLFGKNLAMEGSTPRVFLQREGEGQLLELTLSLADEYQVITQVPSNLEKGHYTVWIHNGTGGDYGWSKGVGIEAQQQSPGAGNIVFVVDEYGADPTDERDDSAAIQAAIDDAIAAGGGTILFSSGRYLVDSAPLHVTQDIEPALAGEIIFQGAGMGKHSWREENRELRGKPLHRVKHTLGEGPHPVNGEVTLIHMDNSGLINRVNKKRRDLLTIDRPHVTLRDLNLSSEIYGLSRKRVLFVKAPDVTIESSRFLLTDMRASSNYRSGTMHSNQAAAIAIHVLGEARFSLKNSELHWGGNVPGVKSVGITPFADKNYVPPPSSDYIHIDNTDFYGYYDGRLEPHRNNRNAEKNNGAFNVGFFNGNSKKVIIENSYFQGADKNNHKVLTRAIKHFNTSTRDTFYANNTGKQMGDTNHPKDGGGKKMTPEGAVIADYKRWIESPEEFHGEIYSLQRYIYQLRNAGYGFRNKARDFSRLYYGNNLGEQIIFHLNYPHGGLFDVLAADANSLKINPLDEKYGPGEGKEPDQYRYRSTHWSQVPKDVFINPSHWVLFVAQGKGVGQYRVVSHAETKRGGRVIFSLEQPWRVVPDETSRVILSAGYRHLHVVDNSISVAPNDPLTKSHGVLLWYNCFGNIVARNRFSNMSGGVVINALYRNPTAWNLTRDNVFDSIYGFPGDTSRPEAAMYVDHIRVENVSKENQVWYTVGNIARNNRGKNAQSAVNLNGRFPAETRSKMRATAFPLIAKNGKNSDQGHIMSVVENNRFENVHTGILIDNPANWTLVRNNFFSTVSPEPKLPRAYRQTLPITRNSTIPVKIEENPSAKKIVVNMAKKYKDKYLDEPTPPPHELLFIPYE